MGSSCGGKSTGNGSCGRGDSMGIAQVCGMGEGYGAGRQDCCGRGSNGAGKQGRNNNLKFTMKTFKLFSKHRVCNFLIWNKFIALN